VGGTASRFLDAVLPTSELEVRIPRLNSGLEMKCPVSLSASVRGEVIRVKIGMEHLSWQKE